MAFIKCKAEFLHSLQSYGLEYIPKASELTVPLMLICLHKMTANEASATRDVPGQGIIQHLILS